MGLSKAVESSQRLFIKQRKEWVEIIFNWETCNRYEICGEDGISLGLVQERSRGFSGLLKRIFSGSHRGFHIDGISNDGQIVFQLRRKFFFFFSDIEVRNSRGMKLGSVHRKFAFFSKKYQLKNEKWQVFAEISSPLWRIWKFPIQNPDGSNTDSFIAKRWTGLLSEYFSDSDTFLVEFGLKQWTENERYVILAASISIDFDFYENNQGD